MRFSPSHKNIFNAKAGAYSLVTPREFFDHQITLSDAEAELATDYFDSIHRGKVAIDKVRARKLFKLFGTDKYIGLNLIFPKPKKNELRLYLSAREGFKPPAGSVWFLFISRDDILTIGAMPEPEWRAIGQNDIDDLAYQIEVEQAEPPEDISSQTTDGEIRTILSGQRRTYYRDPKVAKHRFQTANFRCEFDPSHVTFPSMNGQPYVESHHFIGISLQNAYSIPLDSTDNIFALCPTCHKAIHYARIDFRKDVVLDLYQKRPALETRYNLSIEDALQIYNCENLEDS